MLDSVLIATCSMEIHRFFSSISKHYVFNRTFKAGMGIIYQLKNEAFLNLLKGLWWIIAIGGNVCGCSSDTNKHFKQIPRKTFPMIHLDVRNNEMRWNRAMSLEHYQSEYFSFEYSYLNLRIYVNKLNIFVKLEWITPEGVICSRLSHLCQKIF